MRCRNNNFLALSAKHVPLVLLYGTFRDGCQRDIYFALSLVKREYFGVNSDSVGKC